MLWVLAHEFEKYFNKDRKLMCVHSEYQTHSIIQWFEHAIAHSAVLMLMYVCDWKWSLHVLWLLPYIYINEVI
jgi:hypothetical protein